MAKPDPQKKSTIKIKHRTSIGRSRLSRPKNKKSDRKRYRGQGFP